MIRLIATEICMKMLRNVSEKLGGPQLHLDTRLQALPILMMLSKEFLNLKQAQ